MNENADWIQDWKTQEKGRRKEYKKLVGQLKRKPAKVLTELADDVHYNTFEKYDCLDCANCCTSIPPQLNRTDVNRISKHLGMKSADFRDQYTRQDEDGDIVMKSTPCPFLNKDHTCQVYENRPRACREYPHTHAAQFAQQLDLHLVNARHCPAVFHILERFGELLKAGI